MSLKKRRRSEVNRYLPQRFDEHECEENVWDFRNIMSLNFLGTSKDIKQTSSFFTQGNEAPVPKLKTSQLLKELRNTCSKKNVALQNKDWNNSF